MDRLIYTAISGMSDSMIRQNAIASNLANAQTTGFRAEKFDSAPVAIRAPGSLDARNMVTTGVLGADMSAGSVVETGNTLDIALEGETFLAVQAMDGSEAYTRRGDLSITASGAMMNGAGQPVIGTGGPITVPPDASISIGRDGSVLVSNPQDPSQPPTEVDKIKLVSWQGSAIAKGTDGLFRVRGGGVLPQDEEARVLTGALEGSNVNMTQMLVQMVEAQRLFDIRTKLVATAEELDENGASLMRL